MREFEVGDEIKLPTWDRFHPVVRIDEEKVYVSYKDEEYGYSLKYKDLNWVVKPKETKTKRPHHDVILAWLDGAQIQWAHPNVGVFTGTDHPTWDPELLYRVKPETKPDYVDTFICRTDYSMVRVSEGYGNLKLVYDGETGELKSAEVTIPKED